MGQSTWNPAVPRMCALVSKASVLLVDDNIEDLYYHFDVLLGQGHKVSSCCNYGQAADLLEIRKYDLAFVNQGSRAFEGKVVLERANAIPNRVPVIVLARCSDMDCYLEAMRLGAVDYFQKPVPPALMRNLVETCLGISALA